MAHLPHIDLLVTWSPWWERLFSPTLIFPEIPPTLSLLLREAAHNRLNYVRRRPPGVLGHAAAFLIKRARACGKGDRWWNAITYAASGEELHVLPQLKRIHFGGWSCASDGLVSRMIISRLSTLDRAVVILNWKKCDRDLAAFKGIIEDHPWLDVFVTNISTSFTRALYY